MPSVPTAAITFRNPRPTSANGQARPCRSATQEPKNPPFPPADPALKANSRLRSGVQVTKSKRADIDFHIETALPPPRLG
jgi:hypothetical protein